MKYELSNEAAHKLVARMIELLKAGGWCSETELIDDSLSEWLTDAEFPKEADRAPSTPVAALSELVDKITPENLHPEQGRERKIDTADVVLHVPTKERWLVAFVRGEDLSWVGWPEGWAKLSNCTLVEKATPEAREKLLRAMAAMPGDKDHRPRYARVELEKRGVSE